MTQSWYVRVIDATSQWVNATILNGDPNESISGRSWRMEQAGSTAWGRSRRAIDWLLSWYEANHCHLAYDADVERAHRLVREHAYRLQTGDWIGGTEV